MKLLRVVRDRYQTFQSNQRRQSASRVKGELLDQLGVGYITLDRDFQVLDYNARALCVAGELLNTTSITSAAAQLVGQLSDGESREEKGYCVAMRSYSEVDYFARGLEHKEISRRLFISEGTVKTHLKNIYRKLEIDNQRKLIYEYATHLAIHAAGGPSEGWK